MKIKKHAFRCFQKQPAFRPRGSRPKPVLIFLIALPALLFVLSSFAQHGGGGGGGPRGGGMAPRSAPAFRPSLAPTGHATVERPTHGTIRHLDTHAVQRSFEPQQRIQPGREFAPRHDDFDHRDADIDIHRHRGGDDFRFHRHFRVLPFGFLPLFVGGVPFYYDDGIYYQPAGDGYDEVYPPVGATIPGPPEGAMPVYANGTIYYYAGGAFYLQQPDGSYAIVAAPIGVVVSELPPGAVQVTINGNTAYQFNNTYYEPVFVNGITQFETFVPTG